jgi:hypothetical protein
MKLRRCEDGKMRRGDGEKRGWGEEGMGRRWEEGRLSKVSATEVVINFAFFLNLHFTFHITRQLRIFGRMPVCEKKTCQISCSGIKIA